MITCFDAGHGGDKPGAVFGPYVEKDINLMYCQLLETYHDAHWGDLGCSFMTRTDDRNPTWEERFHEASYTDALVSIHVNAGGGRGGEIFYYSDAGKALAEQVEERWPQFPGGVFRGVKHDSQSQWATGLAILRKTKPPAILIELGFIDDSIDMALIHDLSWGMHFATGVIQALEDWHNERGR